MTPIWSALENWGLLAYVVAFFFDTTSSNTGWRSQWCIYLSRTEILGEETYARMSSPYI